MPEPTYRAPMRSRRDDVPAGAGVERALRVGVCGMGGLLSQVPATLDDAVRAVDREHDERAARRLARFAEAPDGAHVWTRDEDGWHWHGVLDGPWRYDGHEEAHAVDLVHVRPCRWDEAPTPHDRVPGPVLATFARGGRNWQRIHAAG